MDRGAAPSTLIFEGVVTDLMYSLIDSAYGSVVKTYTGANGATGTPYWISRAFDSGSDYGTNPSQAQAESLMEKYFSPLDLNAEYLFITDTGYWLNSGNGTCTNSAENCCAGLNFNGPNYGIHMAYVHNFVSDCPTYNWADVEFNNTTSAFLTPNNFNGTDTKGGIDLSMSYIYHELTERSTDPGGNTNGWEITGEQNNTQMADFCQATPSYPGAFGPYTYQVTTGAGPATANLHSQYGDFLVQMMRVNADVSNWTSTEGYCATSYGGAFWGNNFGFYWSPIGDWASGSYKGECQPQQPLIGLSLYTTGTHNPHAVMCGSASPSSNGGLQFPQSGCQSVAIASGNTTWCPSGDYVAGVAQSESGVPDALLCCPGTGTNGFYCWNQGFSSANMANSWTPYDWDWGYWKAECSAGNFMGGVETNSSAQLTDIECCGPHSGG
jgi:hypothetical protein